MNYKHNIIWLSLVILSLVSIGCGTTQPYVSNELSSELILDQSDYHKFTYIRSYEDKGELVVYGKVRHLHDFCEKEGHVELVSVDDGGQVVYTASLPLLQQSKKRRGWYGAGFRTRVALPTQGKSLRLAFHDEGCYSGFSYDCQNPTTDSKKPVAPVKNQ